MGKSVFPFCEHSPASRKVRSIVYGGVVRLHARMGKWLCCLARCYYAWIEAGRWIVCLAAEIDRRFLWVSCCNFFVDEVV